MLIQILSNLFLLLDEIYLRSGAQTLRPESKDFRLELHRVWRKFESVYILYLS